MIKTFTIFHKILLPGWTHSLLIWSIYQYCTLIMILCISVKIQTVIKWPIMNGSQIWRSLKTFYHCALVYHLKITKNKNKTFKIFHKINNPRWTHFLLILSIYWYCYIDNDTLYITKNTNSYRMANYEWISNLKVSKNLLWLCFII